MILIEREKLLSELEQKIGYSFRSRALLDRALTHRSYAHERSEQNCQHNESLEFLGDSVLGLVVSAWLLQRFPMLTEGKLSKMKAYLVSEPSLIEFADMIELGKYILLNRGEEKTGGRKKGTLLADAYEALIGAVYLDGGLVAAERFLFLEMRDKVFGIDPNEMIGSDYKSALQEKLQATGAPAPKYVVVETLGPDHRRTFRIELRVAGQTLASGEGRSIKVAQQEAAQSALNAADLMSRVHAILHHRHIVHVENGKLEAEEDDLQFVVFGDELAAQPLNGAAETPGFDCLNYDSVFYESDGDAKVELLENEAESS